MTPETKANLSGTAKVGVTLTSGVIAGIAAAILSQVSTDEMTSLKTRSPAIACRHSSVPN